MSIIQTIRDKAAIIVFVLIAISLIAFVLQDALLGTEKVANSKEKSILVIGNKNISSSKFEEVLDVQLQNRFGEGKDQISQQEKYQVIDYVWSQFKDNIISNTIAESSYLVSTVVDLEESLFGENVDAQVRQAFTNQETGEFDRQSVKSYLDNLKQSGTSDQKKQFYTAVIDPLTKGVQVTKLNNILSISDYSPSWKNKLDSVYSAKLADVSYIRLPYYYFSDTIFDISSNKIEQYAKNQRKTYEREKTEKIFKYVTFPVKATYQDSLNILDIVKKAEQDLKTNDKNTLIARKFNSKFVDNSYLKATDFPFDDMSKIKNAKVNQVSNIFFQDNNFFTFKIYEKKNMPDTVFCRHILIGLKDLRTGEQRRTEKEGRELIDSIFTEVKRGANFGQLAQQFSDDEGSKNNGGAYTFTYKDYSNLIPEFADYIFFKRTGFIDTIKTQFGYQLVEVLGQKDFTQKYKAVVIEKPLEPSQKTYDSVAQIAIAFSNKVKQEEDFERLASEQQLQVLDLEEYDEEKFTIGKLDFNRAFVTWIDDVDEVGTLSPLITLDDSYLLAYATEINEKFDLVFDSDKNNIRTQLLKEEKEQKAKDEAKKFTKLEEVAQAFNQKIESIERIGPDNDENNIVDPVFQYAVLDNKQNIQVVGGNLGIYIFQVKKVYTDSLKPYEPISPSPYEQYFKTQKAEKSFNNYLKNNLEIKDNIKIFY